MRGRDRAHHRLQPRPRGHRLLLRPHRVYNVSRHAPEGASGGKRHRSDRLRRPGAFGIPQPSPLHRPHDGIRPGLHGGARGHPALRRQAAGGANAFQHVRGAQIMWGEDTRHEGPLRAALAAESVSHEEDRTGAGELYASHGGKAHKQGLRRRHGEVCAQGLRHVLEPHDSRRLERAALLLARHRAALSSRLSGGHIRRGLPHDNACPSSGAYRGVLPQRHLLGHRADRKPASRHRTRGRQRLPRRAARHEKARVDIPPHRGRRLARVDGPGRCPQAHIAGLPQSRHTEGRPVLVAKSRGVHRLENVCALRQPHAHREPARRTDRFASHEPARGPARAARATCPVAPSVKRLYRGRRDGGKRTGGHRGLRRRKAQLRRAAHRVSQSRSRPQAPANVGGRA